MTNTLIVKFGLVSNTLIVKFGLVSDSITPWSLNLVWCRACSLLYANRNYFTGSVHCKGEYNCLTSLCHCLDGNRRWNQDSINKKLHLKSNVHLTDEAVQAGCADLEGMQKRHPFHCMLISSFSQKEMNDHLSLWSKQWIRNNRFKDVKAHPLFYFIQSIIKYAQYKSNLKTIQYIASKNSFLKLDDSVKP